MAKLIPSYKNLAAGYLFPEIARRTNIYKDNVPTANIIRLGIGDTTEPLPLPIIQGLGQAVNKLGTRDGYSGYGESEGLPELREAVSKYYDHCGASVSALDIFISDGAKSDSANIQSIFTRENIVAVQDPAYPVYVDSNVIAGRSGASKNGFYNGIVYMPCTEENCFFPELPREKVDLIYICSPNNPTGAVATHEQLKKFVDYAIANNSILIFDSAYAAYIQEDSLPRSIYEVEGAKQCAIEISSFSKSAGFTGVRLGWTVVPETLKAEDSSPGEVRSMWLRRQQTFFNGASNISQAGGLVALSEEGQLEMKRLVSYYMGNARCLLSCLESLGLRTYGGVNAPYIWLKTPEEITSWEFFDKLLKECEIVGTPGSGFGPSGEGFFRLSAFGHRYDIEDAVERMQQLRF